MHVVRRGHLYLGLFLLPWAFLYGVTGFLFNHPEALPDQPMVSFGRSHLAKTALAEVPSLREQAERIVAALNVKHEPAAAYSLGTSEPYYASRDFIFATIKGNGRTFNVLFDVYSHAGYVRETTAPPPPKPAPFATGKVAEPRVRNSGTPKTGPSNSSDFKIDDNLVDRFRKAMPALFEGLGLPYEDVTVNSAPDLKFPIACNGDNWIATYGPITHTVTGVPEESSRGDMSIRRFLIRLHLAHLYPGEVGAKWFWAILVDAMSVVLCFWGLSGLFMWWQIKATRITGLAVLAVSTICAISLGIAMFGYLTR